MKGLALLALGCILMVRPVMAYNCSDVKYVPEHPPVWHEGCDTIEVVSTDPDLHGLWAKMHTEPGLRELWPQSLSASGAVSYRHHGGQAHLYRMKTTTPGHGDQRHWVIAKEMFDPHWWYAAPVTGQSPAGSTGWVSALQDGHPAANLTVVCSDNIISTIDLGGGTVVTERMISESPRITVFDNVFTEEEGQRVIKACQGKFQIMNQTAGRQHFQTQVTHWHFEQRDREYIERVLSKRIASLMQVEVQTMNDMTILSYNECHHVLPHWDIFANKFHPSNLFEMKAAPGTRGVNGVRLKGALIYFNTVRHEDGGATLFNAIGLAVQPVAGRVLVFSNRDASFEPDWRTMHTGRPLYGNTKVVGAQFQRISGPVYPRRLSRDKREFDARAAAQLAKAHAEMREQQGDDNDGYDEEYDEGYDESGNNEDRGDQEQETQLPGQPLTSNDADAGDLAGSCLNEQC